MNGRKDMISSFTHIEAFNAYIEVFPRIYKHISSDKICTYSSMNKQYTKCIKNGKKSYLKQTSRKLYGKAMLDLLYNSRPEDMSFQFKKL